MAYAHMWINEHDMLGCKQQGDKLHQATTPSSSHRQSNVQPAKRNIFVNVINSETLVHRKSLIIITKLTSCCCLVLMCEISDCASMDRSWFDSIRISFELSQ